MRRRAVPLFLLMLFLTATVAFGTPLQNGDFSDGTDGFYGWGVADAVGDGITPNSDYATNLDDGTVTIETDFFDMTYLYQDFTIPELATTLSFEFVAAAGDYFEAGLDPDDTSLLSIVLLDWVTPTGSVEVDISALAGQEARLQFGVQSWFGGPASMTFGNIQIATAPVPEPGTFALLAVGLAGLGVHSYRRRKKD